MDFISDIARAIGPSMLVTLILLLAPTSLVVLYGIYNVYLHPLRGYPGPLLWRAYRIPYVASTQQGVLHIRLRDFHARYGSIVRIAPNELSYADSTAWKDIYLNRPGQPVFEKNRTWFKKFAPDDPSSIMAFEEDEHARFRRAFSNSFSDKSLKDQMPVVESYVDLFINRLKEVSAGSEKTRKTIDMMKWINYFAFDLSGDLSFGESFDCLKNGEAHPWVAIAQDFGKGLALIASVNTYPPIDKLLRYIIPKEILQRNIDHRAMTAAIARKRLAIDTSRPDFVTPTKAYNEKKNAFTDREWELNMLVIAFAASETAASALTAMVRELLQSRGVLHRLTQELRSTFTQEEDITSASTKNLPYLNAVINEGLRLDPPVVVGVPRITPHPGSMVCNRWVSGGTYVAYNQFAANRQSYNYSSPNSFLPERFIEQRKGDDMHGFQPFGTGRHSCPGMKLAYSEMRLVLARLVWGFDMKLGDTKDRWDWGAQKSYMLWVSTGI
ncbi:cytochrome P450 [Phaeosphaeria sp. MPI-PUGE-AT-0046c]|nr:cytochrome P450 [Phaeosphaeria sp. MPI-PUGE-AT-0046c]